MVCTITDLLLTVLAKSDKPFQIDFAFDETASQPEVYETAAQSFVDATLKVTTMRLSLLIIFRGLTQPSLHMVKRAQERRTLLVNSLKLV